MKIKENVLLKDFTTWRIGGPARFFCIVTNEDELLEAIGFSKKNKIPYFILGGGSNILVSDNGFNGIVIKMEMKGVEYTDHPEKKDRVSVKVFAGEDWDSFVEETVEKGLYGLENLSLIPGTVGAVPVQNIGAYGVEVKDVIESVYTLDVEKDEYKTFSNKECKFLYRNSLFKESHGRYIIISVDFVLSKNGRLNLEYKGIKENLKKRGIKDPSLIQVRNTVINIRKDKLPDVSMYGTAGSFFKNPVVSQSKARELIKKYPEIMVYRLNNKKVKLSLAWIIDNVCRMRGFSDGRVGTYKKQALVLINHGGATADEVRILAQKIVDDVYERTGVEIFPEVEWIE